MRNRACKKYPLDFVQKLLCLWWKAYKWLPTPSVHRGHYMMSYWVPNYSVSQYKIDRWIKNRNNSQHTRKSNSTCQSGELNIINRVDENRTMAWCSCAAQTHKLPCNCSRAVWGTSIPRPQIFPEASRSTSWIEGPPLLSPEPRRELQALFGNYPVVEIN